MRITSKGQVTIPPEIRERLGLLPGTEVTFETQGRALVIRTVEDDPRAEKGRGESLVRHLRGRAMASSSTDEILALTRGDLPSSGS